MAAAPFMAGAPGMTNSQSDATSSLKISSKRREENALQKLRTISVQVNYDVSLRVLGVPLSDPLRRNSPDVVTHPIAQAPTSALRSCDDTRPSGSRGRLGWCQ